MNLASLWQLPVIFLCQNNQYAEYTSYSESTRSKNLANRAHAYEIPGIQVNGTDPIAIYHVAKEAIARAKDNKGPTFIEAICERLQGHAFGSEEEHMDQNRLLEAKNNSPVKKFRERLISENILSEEEIKKIEISATTEIDAAEKVAESSPPPKKDELYKDVFESHQHIPDLSKSGSRALEDPEIVNEGDSENITYCKFVIR